MTINRKTQKRGRERIWADFFFRLLVFLYLPSVSEISPCWATNLGTSPPKYNKYVQMRRTKRYLPRWYILTHSTCLINWSYAVSPRPGGNKSYTTRESPAPNVISGSASCCCCWEGLSVDLIFFVAVGGCLVRSSIHFFINVAHVHHHLPDQQMIRSLGCPLSKPADYIYKVFNKYYSTLNQNKKLDRPSFSPTDYSCVWMSSNSPVNCRGILEIRAGSKLPTSMDIEMDHRVIILC